MHCTSCGSLLRGDEQTCPVCGARTPNAYVNSGTSASDPTVISSLPAGDRGSGPRSDSTIPSQPMETMRENAPTEYAGYPYGSQATPSGQTTLSDQSSPSGQQNPYTPTPVPNTSYAYGPPPPPPDPYSMRQAGQQSPYIPPPVYANQPVQRSPRRRGGLIAVVLILALLLIGGSAFVYFSNVQRDNQAHTQATATANAQQSATSAAVAQITATANAQATAAAANPYGANGKLAFTDPLTDNSKGHQWDENTNCAFKGGSYHAIAPNPSFGDFCVAQASDYTDFVFEVEMKVLQGDGGGIDFRSANTSTDNHYYDLYVYEDGSYELDVVVGQTSKALNTGSSAAIKKGLNQINVIAAKAQGTTITLYVNHQQITSVNDSTYKQGKVGIEANPYTTGGHPTEVSYSNAKVWTL